jgi:hypothetical protein
MSVSDTLRKYGLVWLESSKLAKLHAQERGISERQARREIAKEYEKKLLTSKSLPTRPPTVLYGLLESPMKEVLQGQESPYVLPFQGFREYRVIFERLTRIEKLDEDQEEPGPLGLNKSLKKMLENVCLNCTRRLDKPPALPALCGPCMNRKTTLYNLTKKQLRGLITKSQLPWAMKFYLISEFKEKLLSLCYQDLIIAKSKMSSEEFKVCAHATFERLNRLRTYDASLEPKIPLWIVTILLEMDSQRGHEWISKAMNALKWHLVEQAINDPSQQLEDVNSQAYNEWSELYTGWLLKLENLKNAFAQT